MTTTLKHFASAEESFFERLCHFGSQDVCPGNEQAEQKKWARKEAIPHFHVQAMN